MSRLLSAAVLLWAARRWLKGARPTSGDSRVAAAAAFVAFWRLMVHWARRRVENPQLQSSFKTPEPELRQREFDYIVVGAGSAGCVLARELATRQPGRTVLLLEAGGDATRDAAVATPNRWTTLWHSEVDWGYSSEPQAALQPRGRRLELERGKTLGGSSAINAMMWVRGAREDFDRWAGEFGCGPAWSYEGVLPSFRALEDCSQLPAADVDPRLRGFGGPMGLEVKADELPECVAFGRACAAAGVPRTPDYNGACQDGFAPTQQSVRAGQRQGGFNCFVEPLLPLESLTVASGLLVTRVLISEGDSLRAEGVAVRDSQGGEFEIRARREVVLCAGALNTPQLLMLSGIGDRAELAAHGIRVRKHLPAVGRQLQDHPACNIMVRMREPMPPRPDSCNLHATAFVRTRAGTPGPNVQLVVASRLPKESFPRMAVVLASARWAGIKAPLLRPVHAALVGAARLARPLVGDKFERLLGIAVILNQPRARGWVRLRSADPAAPPRVDPRLLAHPDDVEDLVRGVRQARAIIAQQPFAELVEQEELPGERFQDSLKDYVRRFTGSVWHYCGTARMGAVEDETTVVDTQLRVFGVEGLRVADASVWPFVVTGNTNAASMMVGHKAGVMMSASGSRL